MKKIIITILILLNTCIIYAEAGGEKALLNKGRKYANKKDYDKALECFNEAVQLNPEYTSAYLAMAVVYVNMKMYYDAINSLINLVLIDESNSSAYYILAMAYEEVGDTFGALDAWSKFLQLRPRGKRSRIAREHVKKLEGGE